MKFNTLFLLSLASSALAISVPMKRDQFEDEAQNLSQIFDGQNFDSEQANTEAAQAFNEMANQYATGLGGLNDPACEKAGKELEKCFVQSEDTNTTCNTFNTNECQAAIKQDFSDCKAFDDLFGLAIATLKLTCTKDESGKYCPISKEVQSGKKEFDGSALSETCKSKICTEQAIEGFSKMKTHLNKMTLNQLSSKDTAEVDKYVATLNEQKCIDAHSGASKVKVGGTLLLALALILSYF